MTPLEQINWDKQVKSGELSFGALKAELAAMRERADRAELAWTEGRRSLNAAIKESIGARESEKWWRAKCNSVEQANRGLRDRHDVLATENARLVRDVRNTPEYLANRAAIQLWEEAAKGWHEKHDVAQASLAEQLAARKVDAEEIARLVTVLAKDAEEITWLKNRMTAIDSQRFKLVKRVIAGGEEVARLKKRVNALIRKRK